MYLSAAFRWFRSNLSLMCHFSNSFAISPYFRRHTGKAALSHPADSRIVLPLYTLLLTLPLVASVSDRVVDSWLQPTGMLHSRHATWGSARSHERQPQTTNQFDKPPQKCLSRRYPSLVPPNLRLPASGTADLQVLQIIDLRHQRRK